MEFRLLGEVELWAAGELLNVGPPRQQAVLAILAVEAPRPVAIETLIDRVWGDDPPVEARNVLYSHLSRIRGLLRCAAGSAGEAAVRVERRHAGYLLDVDPARVDLYRFRRLTEEGSDSRSADADRADALTEALSLWRGTPLAGVTGAWATQVRDRYHRLRLDAAVRWAEVKLRLGHPGPLISRLPDLVAEYPLVEPLEGLLMRALHAAGRDAEALDRYAALRQRLADELGVDPGTELQAVYEAILRGEAPPAPPAEAPDSAARPLAVPAQLPPDIYGFTGRDDELRTLDRLLAAVGICTIHGTPGIGKTATAVHWAHRVADRFSDGQLYVNLRGFDPTDAPVTAAEAVRGFLDAFAVPPERIPTSVPAQVGLYRSLLASRRVLVVLDNARDAEQVRPLLPGAAGCRAVVTSRNQLSGLVAAGGAYPLTLDLPTAAEAGDMLAGRLGADRIAAEPHAVSEIIACCGRLPLALAIVAARAATHPSFSLAALAGELREARDRLDEFAGDDPATDARSVFSWSYRQLTPEAARLFRLLGLHPGPDVGTPAVASLAGASVRQVRRPLAELARAHLVTEHAPGRYTFHDLLRAYAAEQSHTVDSDAERRAATRRMLDHYVCGADTADLLLNPYRFEDPELPPAPPGVDAERLADRRHALAWLVAEHHVLLATIRQAGGFDAHVWHLAWAMTRFHDYHGLWHDAVDVLTAARDAARRLADPRKEAFADGHLGCAHIQLGRHEAARGHLDNALELYRTSGDTAGEAETHRHCSWLLWRQDRHGEALAHAERALDLFRAAGHRPGQARALNAVGWFHALLGDYPDALDYCQQALDLQRELGDRRGQAETWDSLGYVHHHLGQHALAITSYQTAVELYSEFNHRYNAADAQAALGDVHAAAGDLEAARTAWRHALDVLDELGHRRADEVRAKLDAVTGRAFRFVPGAES